MRNSTQFMHFRSASSSLSIGESRAATLAIVQKDANTVLVSAAFCGPNDVFNKKLGRKISEGRITAFLKGREAMVSHVREITISDMDNMKDEVAQVMADELAEHNLF